MLRRKLLGPLLVAVGCAGDEPACRAPTDCPEGLACVYLGADADGGACVEPIAGERLPHTWRGHEELDDEPALDVLLVIDDGPAMAGRQAELAAALDALAAGLTADPQRTASLRFGVTTTDLGNPACDGAPTGGALRLESCLARPDDFVDADAGVDVRAACSDACALAELQPKATSNWDDGGLRARPWLEQAYGAINLENHTDLAGALRCAGLQGVTGCRFTSPLGAIARVLADDDGFHRPDAHLVIVVFSADNDCSIAPGHADIFVDDPTFWGELVPPDLTPAVCWRAGAACTGDGPKYDECHPVDLGAGGEPASDAVLIPVREVVDDLRAALANDDPYRRPVGVAVQVFGGLPPGLAEGAAIEYADADDPAYQAAHGIGPGCVGDGVAAPPPVRLAALAQALPVGEGPPLASLCADDLTASVDRLVTDLGAFIRPGCYPRCVPDGDPATPRLEHGCEVLAVDYSGAGPDRTVPACAREGDAWVAPDGSTRCFIARSGAELDPRCAAVGLNLDIEVRSDPPDADTIHYLVLCPFDGDALNPACGE